MLKRRALAQASGMEVISEPPAARDSGVPAGSIRRVSAHARSRERASSTASARPSAPFFSVVIPIYDRTFEIEQAVQSIVEQSDPSWELILVLDGSPPETRSVVRDIAKDRRVRVFSYEEPSGNACRARNRGILEARGEFVVLLDSDDVALPGRLQSTRRIAETTGSDVIAGCAIYNVQGGTHASVRAGERSYAIPLSLGCLYRLNPFVTSCISIRRSSLLIHGGFRPAMRYREDQELWLRLYYRGCSFHFTDELFGVYRIHEGNLEPLVNNNPDYWVKAVRSEYRLPFKDWGIGTPRAVAQD